jgi:TPR repeat protein
MAWYKKAAEQGDEQARHRLTTGKLIEKPAHHAVIPPAATLTV